MPNEVVQIDWSADWDETVGLWRSTSGGHTAPVAELSCVHSGPNAASRLLTAAQIGALAQVPALAILSALRRMQVEEAGDRQGCFTWYWEESAPVDTNAAFFTGQSLIVLHRCYTEQLDAPCRVLLEEMLAGLRRWFRKCLDERMFYYPNKFLGDLICGWLLHEESDDATTLEAFAGVMHEAAEYWHTHGWGWGEHMSDCYAQVCLDELSLLLLLARCLPVPLREQYHGLFRELLAIEDQFNDTPRVPALRSYAFTASPTHRNYRETIAPLPATLALSELSNQPRLGPIFLELGWERLASPRAPRQSEVTIPCFGGSVARAHCEDDISLGGISRFPLMLSADHPTWGLSWQCFPVAFWRAAGDWGFLQWSVSEEGVTRCHPAEATGHAYLHNALTREMLPPVVGRTWCLQRGSELLALRIMPVIPSAWDTLTDRLRLLSPHPMSIEHAEGDGWSALSLHYPERTMSVVCRPFTGNVMPTLVRQDDRIDWELRYAGSSLADRRLYVTLWGISLHGPIMHAPHLTRAIIPSVPRTPEESAWLLQWSWPSTQWEVIIDPLAATPLIEK